LVSRLEPTRPVKHKLAEALQDCNLMAQVTGSKP